MSVVWRRGAKHFRFFAHCTPTHVHAEDTKSVHQSTICLRSQEFTSILRVTWSALHGNFSPSRRWQLMAWTTRRSRPRWLAAVDDEGVVVPLIDTAQKHVINTHLTLCGTLHRHRQHHRHRRHLPSRNAPSSPPPQPDPQMGRVARSSSPQIETGLPGAHFLFFASRKWWKKSTPKNGPFWVWNSPQALSDPKSAHQGVLEGPQGPHLAVLPACVCEGLGAWSAQMAQLRMNLVKIPAACGEWVLYKRATIRRKRDTCRHERFNVFM